MVVVILFRFDLGSDSFFRGHIFFFDGFLTFVFVVHLLLLLHLLATLQLLLLLLLLGRN